MALDRQTIEKRDFPIGRRGYEPEAVDAHLATIAAEVDALQRTASRRPGESLASVASAQVQAIVEAAESSAAEIEREAREEAAQIRQDAARDAQRTRDEAIQRSQEHVSKVNESTALMLQRVDAMEGELAALVESLRTGANRLSADLSLLEGNMADLYGAAGREAEPEPGLAEPEPAAQTVVSDQPEGAPETAVSDRPPDTAVSDRPQERGSHTVISDQPGTGPVETAAAPDSGVGDQDVEGARLIALNMALNGQPREETDRYLAENFDLGDRSALLDEVYATVEG